MKSNWNYPTTIWTGQNRVNDLNEACKISNIKNPLFVSDENLIKLPMTQKIVNNFKNLNIFSNFTGNPNGKNVDEGVKAFHNNHCDGVIAFGGGSALDVGKTIAFMSGQSRSLWDFEDIGDYWKRANHNNI